MGSISDHADLRGDHSICSLVPGVCIHLVGDGDHGHRLLHGSLRVDDGDRSWKVQDLHQHVYELLLALVPPDHCR